VPKTGLNCRDNEKTKMSPTNKTKKPLDSSPSSVLTHLCPWVKSLLVGLSEEAWQGRSDLYLSAVSQFP
jgi:hypothetical protein